MADDVLRFAQVNFRRDRRVFGIKREDRFSHVYIIGKTGTGKSTLLETMALEDLALGNGFALIDPHGNWSSVSPARCLNPAAARSSTSMPRIRLSRMATTRSVMSAPTDPPPPKWSTVSYGFALK